LLDYVRQGGALIIGVGEKTDISKLNREILVPAKAGYMKAVAVSSAKPGKGGKQPARKITLHEELLKSKDRALKEVKPMADVTKQLSIKLNEQISPVLSTSQGPILVNIPYKKGSIYLWTTDIDNLEWTSLGASAFVPIYHQWIVNESGQLRWKNYAIDSDSIFIHSLESEMRNDVAVTDPQRKRFKSIKKHYNTLHIGPFAKLGHYNINYGQDTILLAVNLAKKETNAGSKKEYYQEVKSFKSQHLRVEPDEILAALTGTSHRLWKLFVFGAIVFLLLEVLISRLLIPGTSLPRKA
jgi:hypothetical protein